MVVTHRSSAMPPSGDVSRRMVKPLPGPGVKVPTMFAPKSRSVGLVVVTDPLKSDRGVLWMPVSSSTLNVLLFGG